MARPRASLCGAGGGTTRLTRVFSCLRPCVLVRSCRNAHANPDGPNMNSIPRYAKMNSFFRLFRDSGSRTNSRNPGCSSTARFVAGSMCGRTERSEIYRSSRLSVRGKLALPTRWNDFARLSILPGDIQFVSHTRILFIYFVLSVDSSLKQWQAWKRRFIGAIDDR